MTEWMKELTLLAEAEFRARRIVATLATAGLDGFPAARTVIIRHLDEETGLIWMTTDGRTAKVEQLQSNPKAALVFWAPHERVQFRVRGGIEIHRSGPMRLELWHGFNDAARAMFFWPTPGTRRSADDKYPMVVADHVPPPDSFLALSLRAIEAESLELNDSPHRRRRWSQASNWQAELINP